MLQTLLALRNRQGKRGFTLIELLVVVAIIGILATFAFPRVYEAMQQVNDGKGRTAIKSLSVALEQEYFKSGGATGATAKYPTDAATALKDRLGDYMKSGFTFKNGHGAGFLYFTDTNGKGFILVDVKRMPVGSSITICGSAITTTNDLFVKSDLTSAALESCDPTAATWDDPKVTGTSNPADIYYERN